MPTVDPATPPRAPAARPGPRAVVAGGFVLLFAFLLASFPARNPDVWGYLVAGRALAHGERPAAGAEAGWLFDLACYGVHAVAGPAGLVIAKALLVAALAVVLLRLSRAGSGWWVAVFCTGLAVLAMAARMFLQPATVSYLFLGLALWLVRPRADARASAWPGWPLVALFVVWANTDRWFGLGLGAVLLVEVGRALDRPAAERARALGRAVTAFAVLTAACLVNPSTVQAFGLPAALTVGGPGPGGIRGATSPFQRAYLDAVSQLPAGLAYFPLLGLGLLSFALTVRAWRWERFLPWAALAVVSAVQVRTVPFFAVVGGPVLAWNLQDVFARRAAAAATTRPRRRELAVAVLGGVFGLVFLAAAWTGWLQGPPFGPRQWAVEPPPGFRPGAEAVCRWQADGRLGPSPAGLHLSADTVAAFTWFCPEHRPVRDPVAVAALRGESVSPDWADRLRAAGVTYLVVYDADRRLGETLDRLLADPDQWPLLHLGGGVTVFGWRDPARPPGTDPFAWAAGDLDRLALWPKPEERAPPARPAAEPDPRRWWEAFWKPAPRPSADRDVAAVYLRKAEALRQAAVPGHLAAWEATEVAGLVAAGGGWAGPGGLLDARTRLEYFRPELTDQHSLSHPLGRVAQFHQAAFQRARGDTPAAVLLLAVRAARRAVAADPRDAQAYALLGEAYLRLAQGTWERGWSQTLAEVGQLRRAQAAAALSRAVAINPNLAEAHFQLRALYFDLGFLDLALKHQRAYVAAVRKAGPPSGVRPDAYRAALAEAEQQLDRLAEMVDDREQAYAREATDVRVLDRAVLANDKGLAGKALDILLGSDISAFGANGMALQLELLVRTGRAREVREWTTEAHRETLGGMYYWLRAQAFAADGDYALAAEECTRLAAAGPGQAAGPGGAGARELGAVHAAQAVLAGARTPFDRAGPVWEAFTQRDFRPRLGQLVAALRREADSLTLRGLIALEEGDTEAAAADFRQALRTWHSPQAVREGWGLDFLGRPAARQALAWIESVPPPDRP